MIIQKTNAVCQFCSAKTLQIVKSIPFVDWEISRCNKATNPSPRDFCKDHGGICLSTSVANVFAKETNKICPTDRCSSISPFPRPWALSSMVLPAFLMESPQKPQRVIVCCWNTCTSCKVRDSLFSLFCRKKNYFWESHKRSGTDQSNSKCFKSNHRSNGECVAGPKAPFCHFMHQKCKCALFFRLARWKRRSFVFVFVFVFLFVFVFVLSVVF